MLVACMVLAAPRTAEAQDTRPRLVVNIVVGSMRANDIVRYANGFGEGGFTRAGSTDQNDVLDLFC